MHTKVSVISSRILFYTLPFALWTAKDVWTVDSMQRQCYCMPTKLWFLPPSPLDYVETP